MILRKLTSTHVGYWWPISFFRATQTQVSWSLKLYFWRSQNIPCQDWLQGVSNLKNKHLLMFAFIKSAWSAVRWSRLFLRKDMILRKLASIHVGYWWPIKFWEFPFLPVPKSSPFLDLLNEVYNDDTSEFQGQFNHAEFVFDNGLALEPTGVAVELVKVGTFGQKWPQNDWKLAL